MKLSHPHDKAGHDGTRLSIGYCDHHDFPLPAQHKFPLAKYRLLHERLADDTRFAIETAPLAGRELVLAVHDQEYVDGFLTGELAPGVMRRIGFPWSPELVRRTLASAGSTLEAIQNAMAKGFGGSLAGGTHHAFRNAGAGFCVFNDLAMAIMWARAEAGLKRAAVVDLDVHQGDGTAAIFEGDRDIFTLSLHGARNFPFRKQRSTLDVELPDGTEDARYLEVLERALTKVWEFRPELILYQAGVDGLGSDRLGRLALTRAGLATRDRMVMGEAHRRGVPLAVVIGGGYSEPIDATVDAHAQTFQIAAEIYFGDAPGPNRPSRD